MSEHMKKLLTNEDIEIFVKGEKVKLKNTVMNSLANIINELVEEESYSAAEVFGDWLKSPRMRAAKYLKGSRVKKGFTQVQVCKKLKINQSNLSSMEHGKRPIPSSLILKFMKLYGIDREMIDENMIEEELRNSDSYN